METSFVRASLLWIIILIGMNTFVLHVVDKQTPEIDRNFFTAVVDSSKDSRGGAPNAKQIANAKTTGAEVEASLPIKHADIVQQSTPRENINTSPSSPYAYFWIIGAIHEDRPSYKGFIWDVLISASLLRKTGSTADFWLYVRLSPDSKLDTMPTEDLRLLDALGVKVKHLDKPEHESFSQLMYDKFYILNMTDYKRVMYLDADTIPLTNLDYLFYLSDPENKDLPTLLKPFFLFATRKEPTNGGLFIVEPSTRIYEQYKETVRVQHEKAKMLPYPHFNKLQGWGYTFKRYNDKWEAINSDGNSWSWYGAHVDQGLMYYIAKFLSKETSIAIGQRLQNWKGVPGQDKPEKESETLGTLEKYQPKLLAYQFECDKYALNEKVGAWDFQWSCNPPYNSIAHFYGAKKPWQKKFKKEWLKGGHFLEDTSVKKAPAMLWFKELDELNDKHKMGIDLEHWNDKHLPAMKESALGYIPLNKDQADIIEHISKEGAFASKK